MRRVLPGIAAATMMTGAALAGVSAETRAAAEQGDARAQYALAIMYDTGDGVPHDFAEALKWFRRSAEGGYAPGQAKLGLMVRYGWATPRDATEAAKWYGRAAAQGHVEAQAILAGFYAAGRGVQRDDVAALMWASLAARTGDAAARLRNTLTARMSAGAIAEAERRAKAWKPER